MITDTSVLKNEIAAKKSQCGRAAVPVPADLDTSALCSPQRDTPGAFTKVSGPGQARLGKCESRDSLVSLQQLAGRAVSPLGSVRKYIDDDTSRYGNTTKHADTPTSSNVQYMNPGAVFSGCQMSGYKRYKVTVSVWRAEFPVSSLDAGIAAAATTHGPHVCGELTIHGLTPANPCMSTYFEGYAVTSSSHGFMSRDWPRELRDMTASDTIDSEHWLRFPACKQLSVCNGHLPQHVPDYANQRYVYMRWKEKFMLPDPEAEGVVGASYDGFYYVVLDQWDGSLDGYYYQEQADKFQQLDLHCDSAGHTGTGFEFA